MRPTLYEQFVVKTAYPIKSLTAASEDTAATAIDTTGYTDAYFYCTAKHGAVTGVTWTVKASATSGGSYAALTGATATVAVADTDKTQCIHVKLEGFNNYSSGATVKPFLKCFPTPDTTTATICFAWVVLVNKAAGPVTTLQELTPVSV